MTKIRTWGIVPSRTITATNSDSSRHSARALDAMSTGSHACPRRSSSVTTSVLDVTRDGRCNGRNRVERPRTAKRDAAILVAWLLTVRADRNVAKSGTLAFNVRP